MGIKGITNDDRGKIGYHGDDGRGTLKSINGYGADMFSYPGQGLIRPDAFGLYPKSAGMVEGDSKGFLAVGILAAVTIGLAVWYDRR